MVAAEARGRVREWHHCDQNRTEPNQTSVSLFGKDSEFIAQMFQKWGWSGERATYVFKKKKKRNKRNHIHKKAMMGVPAHV